MVAPVASSGGGTPAYGFSGAERGGKEGLSEMMRKYPNWFSPHLHEFWGKPDKLPFDEHWFMALAAPRPFIAPHLVFCLIAGPSVRTTKAIPQKRGQQTRNIGRCIHVWKNFTVSESSE
jgi:hypothetical protein